MGSPLWRIALFGGPTLTPVDPEGGPPITRFRTRRAAALLAYLASRLPDPRPIGRERLAELIWPESEPVAARNRLKQELASLRRQLEPPGVVAGGVLVTDRHGVGLNPAAVVCDLAELRAARRRGLPIPAWVAVDDDLLPDLYDEWVVALRTEAEALRESAVRRLPDASPLVPMAPPERDIRLPATLTRFFGRESERERIESSFARGERLITLTGGGGCGKTRLAVEAAAETSFATVRFAPLADLADPAALPRQLARALGGADAQVETIEALGAALAARPEPHLLVLDNFEHLAVDPLGPLTVARLLEAAPKLSCLVTSRQRLGLAGERELVVEPLQIPPDGTPCERLADYPSVRLFLDRARDVRPDFPLTVHNAAAVRDLVAALDGVPLALEIAASWAQTLSVARIHAQIARRLDLEAPAVASERHRSLRATVAWSLSLLTPALQRFARQLTLFQGGCAVDAAATVCDEPAAALLLTQLRERSLLLTEEQAGEIRFRMLETVREVLAEGRTSEETRKLERRLTDWTRNLLEEARGGLVGPDQGLWLDRLEAEHPNLRTVLSICLRPEHDDPQEALWIAGHCERFWEWRGHLHEGRRWLRRALDYPGAETPSRERAYACNGLAILEHYLGNTSETLRLFQEALTLRRAVGTPLEVATSQGNLGLWRAMQGQFADASVDLESAVAILRAVWDESPTPAVALDLGRYLLHQATVTEDLGDPHKALELGLKARPFIETPGGSHDCGLLENALANFHDACGDAEGAAECMERSLEHFRAAGLVTGICLALPNAALLQIRAGRLERAAILLEECFEHTARSNESLPEIRASVAVAELLIVRDEPEVAARLLGAARAQRERTLRPASGSEDRHYSRLLDAVRGMLAPRRLERALADGAALPWPEVVRRARQALLPLLPTSD